MSDALSPFRICDFTGQLAGAGATKWLAAFGAEVIRIEDPVMQGRWDILRGNPPFKDERRGIDLGGAFNNHNVEKYGITLNLRTDKAKEMLAGIIAQSDVVTENFAAGVLEKWGFGFDAMKAIKPDIIYVSNCGFGHTGPYKSFRTWGPIVQAVSGLTFSSGLPGREPAGWGYSYMDHTGGYYMAMAIMLALLHRQRSGEGQWVDLACTEAATTLNGPALLDWSVNGRAMRSTPFNSNRAQFNKMAPHGIYPCRGDDDWIAIACRDDQDWAALEGVIDAPWCAQFATQDSRLAGEDRLDEQIAAWTGGFDKFELQARLRALPIPVAAVQKPAERIDGDPATGNFGLWPTVQQTAMGAVRVDGQPVHMSETDWRANRGGPCLGEHNVEIFGRLLGMSADEVDRLQQEGVI
ncbi:MAG TPA: CoA transferase [Pseudomonadales bacterium]|nr:CoA transferase [Pseudomonadales bacterium]